EAATARRLTLLVTAHFDGRVDIVHVIDAASAVERLRSNDWDDDTGRVSASRLGWSRLCVGEAGLAPPPQLRDQPDA
ncbi:hypothetical protein ABTK89_19790, partial [Acinetobacter baumannii]